MAMLARYISPSNRLIISALFALSVLFCILALIDFMGMLRLRSEAKRL